MVASAGSVGTPIVEIFQQHLEEADGVDAWEVLLRVLQKLDSSLTAAVVCRTLASMVGSAIGFGGKSSDGGSVGIGVHDFIGFLFGPSAFAADVLRLQGLGVPLAKASDSVAYARSTSLLEVVGAFTSAALDAKASDLRQFGVDYFRAREGVAQAEASPMPSSRSGAQSSRDVGAEKPIALNTKSTNVVVRPGVSVNALPDIGQLSRQPSRQLSRSWSNRESVARGLSSRSLGAGEQGTLEIRLDRVDGEEFCAVRVPRGATIAELRKAIFDKTGIPRLQQELLLGSNLLTQEHDMLADVLADLPDSNIRIVLLVRPAEEFFDEVVTWRKEISKETNPPIEEAIDAGIVPKCVRYLWETTWPALQFEAGWVLTNIASGNGEQTECVVNHGAIPGFLAQLSSPNKDVAMQAVWALGNIAGDSAAHRDIVLTAGGIEKLLEVVHKFPGDSIGENLAWAFSNLTRGRPHPSHHSTKPFVDRLRSLLKSDNEEDLADLCWAASYLSDGPNENGHRIVEAGIVPRIAQLLTHSNPTVTTPALRTIGNICSSDEEDTDSVLNAGFLPSCFRLLAHQKRNIRKETCWALSNITAGTHEQAMAVVTSGLVPLLVEIVRNADGENDIRKEAVFAVTNPLNHRDVATRLMELGTLDALFVVLSGDAGFRSSVVSIILTGIRDGLREFSAASDPAMAHYILRSLDGRAALEELLDSLEEDGETSKVEDILKLLDQHA